MSHKTGENIHRYREDDGAVVFGRNTAQCLQVTQLKDIKLDTLDVLESLDLLAELQDCP